MENSIPWTEKYRPGNIEEMILDKEVEQQIRIFLLDREDVHLIITGVPGVGKTSSVRCIAKKILGENITSGYLELNAAEDRGVRSITSIIPPFCKRIVNFKSSKIILFDEADNMTQKSQYEINDMIKEYGKKTKFIFTCNNSTKIINDIQSICSIIHFKKLTNDQIIKYLTKICQIENIKYDKSGLEIICYISDGDMRKSINDLQKIAYTYENVTKKNVLNICKVPDPHEIEKIIKLCMKKDLVRADKEMDNIVKQGYYYLDIISGFVYVLSKCDIPNNLKLRLTEIVNSTRITVSTGLRTRLQLSGMICRLIKEID